MVTGKLRDETVGAEVPQSVRAGVFVGGFAPRLGVAFDEQ